MQDTKEQTTTISKTGFAKNWAHCSFQAPMGWVSNKKTDCDKFKSFSYP